MRRALSLAAIAAALAACYPAPILTPDGREKVVRASARQPRYLRVAVYAGPFFGDDARVLLADRPASELVLSGAPPGATPVFDRVLPPGTPIFVDGVRFPTGSALWTRPEATPRFQPWVVGRTAAEERAVVLLLSARPATSEDLLAEMGRVLTADDPAPAYRALPEFQRSAILRKEVVEGMGREAVAMAWGYPDRIVVDDAGRSEEWSWSGGARRATFQDERLVRSESRRADPPRG